MRGKRTFRPKSKNKATGNLDLQKHVLFWHSWGLPKLVDQNLFFSESQTKTSTKTRIADPRRK
jgi:hypothetical protein